MKNSFKRHFTHLEVDQILETKYKHIGVLSENSDTLTEITKLTLQKLKLMEYSLTRHFRLYLNITT